MFMRILFACHSHTIRTHLHHYFTPTVNHIRVCEWLRSSGYLQFDIDIRSEQ